MGMTKQKLVVKENRSRRKATINFLIDSGAVYSLAPASTLKKLGIRPHREVDFTLADGTTITLSIGLILDPFKRRLIPMRMLLA
jgi:predicted aspartyl protease